MILGSDLHLGLPCVEAQATDSMTSHVHREVWRQCQECEWKDAGWTKGKTLRRNGRCPGSLLPLHPQPLSIHHGGCKLTSCRHAEHETLRIDTMTG